MLREIKHIFSNIWIITPAIFFLITFIQLTHCGAGGDDDSAATRPMPTATMTTTTQYTSFTLSTGTTISSFTPGSTTTYTETDEIGNGYNGYPPNTTTSTTISFTAEAAGTIPDGPNAVLTIYGTMSGCSSFNNLWHEDWDMFAVDMGNHTNISISLEWAAMEERDLDLRIYSAPYDDTVVAYGIAEHKSIDPPETINSPADVQEIFFPQALSPSTSYTLMVLGWSCPDDFPYTLRVIGY